MEHRLYIGLGSNMGDRRAYLYEALRLLSLRVGSLKRVSRIMESEPWGYTSAHAYLNCVALVETRLSPWQCLEVTQTIERQLGRTQKTTDGQYHDRPIDIDLLVYDNLQIETPELTLPHPFIQQRDFVRIPLSEIQ